MRVVVLATVLLSVLVFAEIKFLHHAGPDASASANSVLVTPQTMPVPNFTTPAPVDPPKNAPASRAASASAHLTLPPTRHPSAVPSVRPTRRPTVAPTHSATPVPLIIVPITPTATASHVPTGAICNDGHITHKIKDCPCKHHHGVREWLYA